MAKVQFCLCVILLLLNVDLFPKTQAADDNDPVTSRQEPSSAVQANNIVEQWGKLYDFLYEDNNFGMTGDHVKSTLEEMEALERMPEFDNAMKMLAPISKYSDRLTKYKLMEISFRERAIIVRPETSLTQTLLEIFSQGTHECAKLYFAKLDSIIKRFRGEPIHQTLKANREMKNESCWFRFVNALETVSLLMGSEKLGILNNLRNRIEFLRKNLAYDSPDDSSDDSSKESRSRPKIKHYLGKKMNARETDIYAQAFATFLQNRQIASNSHQNDELQDFYLQFDNAYKQLIIEPCAALIPLALRIMDDLNDFMTHFLRLRRDYMTDDHFKTIDVTKMCSKVLTNENLQNDTKKKHKDMYVENLVTLVEKNNRQLLATAEKNDLKIQSLLAKGPYVEPPEAEDDQHSRRRRLLRDSMTDIPVVGSPTQIPSLSPLTSQPGLANPPTISSELRGHFYDSDSNSDLDSEQLLNTFDNNNRLKAYQIELQKLLSYNDPPKEPEQMASSSRPGGSIFDSPDFSLDNMPSYLNLDASPDPNPNPNSDPNQEQN